MFGTLDSFPYSAHRHKVGSYTMTYRDEGPEDSSGSAPVVLCVHGNPTWSFYYRRVIDRFRESHRVIAVDHIGCGESDKPPQSQYSYRLADHQKNLVSLIDELDLKNITLVAHDWGGAIGLGCVVERKARFSKIVLLNTGAFPPPYVPLRIRACRFPFLGTWAMRRLNLFAKAAITMAMSRNRLTIEAAKGLLAPYHDWESRVAIDAFVRDIPLTKNHPTYETLSRLEASLPELADLPSLLVWGMKDWCFRPECFQRFQSVWPNAISRPIEDAGHYVLEDAPDETLDAIARFLDVDADQHAQ